MASPAGKTPCVILRFIKWYGVILLAELLHIILVSVGQRTSCEIYCETPTLDASTHALLVILALLVTMFIEDSQK